MSKSTLRVYQPVFSRYFTLGRKTLCACSRTFSGNASRTFSPLLYRRGKVIARQSVQQREEHQLARFGAMQLAFRLGGSLRFARHCQKVGQRNFWARSVAQSSPNGSRPASARHGNCDATPRFFIYACFHVLYKIEAMRRCGLTLIAHAWVSIGRQHKLPDPCDFPDLEHFIFIEVFSLVLCISSGTI